MFKVSPVFHRDLKEHSMKSGRSWFSQDDRLVFQANVQDLAVRHVIGFNKDSCSTPLVFGPDGIVAYLAGRFVTLYDLRTYCQVQHLSLESRKNAFSCLAISKDANLLAAGEQGQNPSVVVWQLDGFPVRHPFELKGHKDTITAISFSPNGKYLATVGNVQDSQLIVWDCQMETAVCSQLLHIQANLTSLSFSTDSKVLYSAGKSHFTMWSLRQKSGKGGASVSGVSLTSKSAVPSSEKLMDIVDAKAGHTGKSSFVFAITKKGLLYKLRLHKGGMSTEKKIDLRVNSAFSLAVGGNKIAVACGNGIVKIIRSKNLSIEATFSKPLNDPQSPSASVSPDALNCAFDELSSTLVVGYADGSVCFWDVEDTSEIRCVHMLHSHSGSIADIFSIPSAESEQKSIDRSVVKAMRSPNIHNPKAVESEFATCSDKGIINLWNLKIQSAQPRQHVLISPASERPGMWSNPRVEIHVKSVSVNPPPAPKSRGSGRKTKGTVSSVKPKKESRKSLASKSLPAVPPRPKRVPAKKSSAIPSSIPKRPVPKKKESGLKPTQRGKRVLGTGSMRLSTELTGSTVMRAPVVAIPKAGPSSKHSPVESEASRPVPADDAHLTCIRTSPDCLHLVVGDDKGQLRIYHLASMKLLSKRALHKSPITAIEFSLPGEHGELLLATGAKDGSVSVMEVHNDFKIKLEKDDHDQPVTGLSFSPEGKAVVSCGRDNYLYYESLNPADFDYEEDAELFLSRHFLMTSTFEAMHFNAARNTYLLACSDNFIRVFNAMGQFVHAITIPEELGAPTRILQGPIPSMIITCHENTIGVFEYFTGQLLAMGECHSKLTGALLINNGRNLVTTGEDGVMVIWDLPEELCRRCIACPGECNVPQVESGYATELFHKMQREKQRASKLETDNCCHDERNSGQPLMEKMVAFEHSLLTGASTPVQARPESRMSGTGLPMVSPVAQASRPLTMPKKDAVHLPSWMSKADGMSDDGFLDGFESASPSAYSRPPPPRLDLGSISDTDDESIALPVQLNRGHSLWNSRFNDLDRLPIDDFNAGPGFSRRGLNFEHDRFNHPVDSTRWGRRSKESYSGSPYGLHPCSSLAQYVDERSDSIYRHRDDSMDRGYARPTGPEPPSSVSCASDSRTSTPFSMHPTSCFESEAMRNFHYPFGFSDEQFALSRSPHSGNGPLGPHFRRLMSRTPQSMYSDDKTVYTRPNSEEHTKKMFSEFPGISDESVSPVPSPFKMDVKNVYWGIGEDEDVAFSSDVDDEEPIEFVCQTDERPDTPIARAGGRMNKNPLYSSGSEVSDVGHYETRAMGLSFGSVNELAALEKETCFIDIAEENESNTGESVDADGLDGSLQSSMDAFWKTIHSTVVDSLEKLKDKSFADCKIPSDRKRAYLDKAKREISAFLETLQGHT